MQVNERRMLFSVRHALCLAAALDRQLHVVLQHFLLQSFLGMGNDNNLDLVVNRRLHRRGLIDYLCRRVLNIHVLGSSSELHKSKADVRQSEGQESFGTPLTELIKSFPLWTEI